ncbi:AraC family transcriptional regulator [Paenibacillus lycopersici]|uniref:AraC family transcriptional regulator n=1 Tax=Paenibacillus lycopersici TaxID=2704462 RepID=A0A6C0G1P9_9BACL|nr:helix-turn-helix domain-containing protein [Paenibacillus lycopersici]QHT62322.1 AraC family transcriptional regulator [Paenibacillus lycopersici]
MKPRKGLKFYAKVFALLTIAVSVTITAISIYLYVHFEQIVLKQTYAYTNNNLSQTSREASIMTVTAGALAKQIYYDEHINKLLNFDQLDAIDMRAAINQLNAYQATSPFIDSIYVYNSAKRTFYISTDLKESAVQNAGDFYDRGIVDIVNDYTEYPNMLPIPRKIPIADYSTISKEKERDCYSFLLYDTLTQGGDRNVIVINISEVQMHKYIDELVSNADNNTFIIDRKGILVSNSWKYPMLSDISAKSYIGPIVESSQSYGYFVQSVEGVKSLITYTAPDNLGWRYIRILPYESITSQISAMRWRTLMTAILCLVLGLLASYAASRKFFAGVDEKFAQLKTLEADRRDSFQTMRREFLQNLLLGTVQKDPLAIRRKLEHLELPLDAEAPCRILLLRIDDYQAFTLQYHGTDRNLLKFGIINVAEELLNKRYRSVALDLGEDRIAVIVSVLDEPKDRAALGDTVKEIQAAARSYFKVSVTASISNAGSALMDVQERYGEAFEASYYRLTAGHEAVIWADEADRRAGKDYEYSAQKEKQLLDDLKLGRIADAKALIGELLAEAAGCSYMSLTFALFKLTHAIHGAMTTIERNSASSLHIDAHSLLGAVNQAETLDEVASMYGTVLDRLDAVMDERRSPRHDETVQRIVDIIERQFMNQNLSLESLADELEMSTTYISRLFKKQMNKTILNHIIEVRMRHVQDKLLGTDDSIGEIAEASGFSNSPHFYKAFKQYNGVTPANYRRSGRQQAALADDEESGA